MYDVYDDYNVLLPSYEKTYGSGTFLYDLRNIHYVDFMLKVNVAEEPFQDLLQCRSVALTQRRTKENKEYYDRGKKSLLPFQEEWLRENIHKREQKRIDVIRDIEGKQAQDMMNRKIAERNKK